MSLTQTPPPEVDAVVARPQRRARGGGASSLVAHGEPMVWLTGGALATCLAMVVSLLIFVCYQGGKTFWPVPLESIRLRTGPTLLGEAARSEDYRLPKQMLLELPAPLRATVRPRFHEQYDPPAELAQHYALPREALAALDEAAQAPLRGVLRRFDAMYSHALLPAAAFDGLPEGLKAALKPALVTDPDAVRDVMLPESAYITAYRTLYRTGNFELTNEHFTWVEDHAVESARTPAWAVVFEREKNGRFYGQFLGYHEARKWDPVRDTQGRLPPKAGVLVRVGEGNAHDLVRAERLLPDDQPAMVLEMDSGPAWDNVTLAVQDERPQGGAVHVRPGAWVDLDLTQTLPAGASAPTGEPMYFVSQPTSGRVELLADGRTARYTPAAGFTGPARFTVFVADDAKASAAWGDFESHHGEALARGRERKKIQKHDLGAISVERERARLAQKAAARRYGAGSPEHLEATLEWLKLTGYIVPGAMVTALSAEERKSLIQERGLLTPGPDGDYLLDEEHLHEAPAAWAARIEGDAKGPGGVIRLGELKRRSMAVQGRIDELDRDNARYGVLVGTTDGRLKHLELSEIVRAYPGNRLSFGAKADVYRDRWSEFLLDDPREANSEGGVLPAIFGTVVMTILMSLAVVPFGVLAALYLREYAKAGPLISVVRIAVNNLAGVPSIVFGVFGLGFFCYGMGKYVDAGPVNGLGIRPMGVGMWTGLAVLTAGLAGAAAWLGARANSSRGKTDRALQVRQGRLALGLWLVSAAALLALIVYTPLFEGFFPVQWQEGRPTYGTGGVLWASLTLSLLTLPVVIVATEEALAAVPNSMREGSYACGASKWQTIQRIVLPRAMPGIMTGMILAMARGAGEVAPLMLVGAVKLAPHLPVDGLFPYVHPERSFMHLGFHIYDVGFQSQNSEAAKPMVFTTTLLLILIITSLNVAAIWIRARLRRKFSTGQF